MRRLLAIAAILAAAMVTLATGAFTSVSADREAHISVTGDASALLGLEAHAPYASYDDDGALKIELSHGVNVEAETNLGKVFSITNNGTQQVTVTIYQMLGGTDVTETSSILFTHSPDGNPSSMHPVWGTPIGSGETLDVYVKVYTNMSDTYPYEIGTVMDHMVIVAE
jgi:FlaG/FlaF family flagellin (archaellin)